MFRSSMAEIRFIIPIILVLAIAGTAGSVQAANKDRSFTALGSLSCGEYLDAYARSTLTGDGGLKGPHETWGAFGWIDGYLSAYNQLVMNGKANILGSMTVNNARRWVASSCRDSPSESLINAIINLTKKLDK